MRKNGLGNQKTADTIDCCSVGLVEIFPTVQQSPNRK